MCVSKREMYMRKIQELGSLPPSSELSEHANLGIQALMRALENCNRQLKKYSHVNKKAYDQYVNFSEQREQLLSRKVELDNGADKVKELIDSLDRQKDEAINRTFRGVSAHFKDVFTELVPDGAGELILRTALDESEKSTAEAAANDTDNEDESKSSSSPSVNLYRGVDVKVRFSAIGENYLMSQLSGGQKALVAMALIFAIQRCDPAPFYIFDELDQALDSTYRAAVANVILRQSSNKENPTQFICSSFRPELAAVANRCYGISHQNKVRRLCGARQKHVVVKLAFTTSHICDGAWSLHFCLQESKIHMLSKNDALKFIANLMSEEEAVGEVTSMATSRSRHASLGARRKGLETTVEEQDESSEEVVDGGDSSPGEASAEVLACKKRVRQAAE